MVFFVDLDDNDHHHHDDDSNVKPDRGDVLLRPAIAPPTFYNSVTEAFGCYP